jgi:hypothetical protein
VIDRERARYMRELTKLEEENFFTELKDLDKSDPVREILLQIVRDSEVNLWLKFSRDSFMTKKYADSYMDALQAKAVFAALHKFLAKSRDRRMKKRFGR